MDVLGANMISVHSKWAAKRGAGKKTKGIILFSLEDILRMINIELRISFDELYSCLHHLPGFEHFWGNG